MSHLINIHNYEILFDDHYRGLCAYAYQFVGDMDMSEDIVQDVFYNLWIKRNEILLTSSSKSYLFSSVRNRCLDLIKHKKVENRYLSIGLKEIESSYNADSCIETELKEILDKTLNLLPENLKDVFILNKISGLTAARIGELKGISKRTIECK